MPTPVAAYVRMSSSKQDKSPTQQRELITSYAAERGYEIIRWYKDEGIGGWKTARPGFQTMLADAQSGEFTGIVVWDQDRFSRFKPLEFFEHVGPLVKAGVWIETVSEKKRLDFAGRFDWLFHGLAQDGKSQYVYDLSRNCTRGLGQAAKDGRCPGSRPAYGYRKRDSRLILGPDEEAATVKWIFDQFAGNSISIRRLAGMLNDRGTPSPTSKKWGTNSVKNILRNDTYTGVFTWPRSAKGQFHYVGEGGEPVAKLAGQGSERPKNGFQVQLECPAIVSRDLFDRVAAKLTKPGKRQRPHGDNQRPLAGGILRCGHCGGSMVKHKKDYYICGSHSQRRCDYHLIREDAILPFIVQRLLAEMDESALRDRAAGMPENTGGGQAAIIERRLAAIQKRIEAATEAAIEAPKGQRALFYAKLEELQAEKKTAMQQAAAAKKEPQPTLKNFISRYAGWWKSVKDRLVRIYPSVQYAPDAPIDWNSGSAGIDFQGADLRQLFLDLNCQITLLWEPLKQVKGRWKYRVASGQFVIGGQSGDLSFSGQLTCGS